MIASSSSFRPWWMLNLWPKMCLPSLLVLSSPSALFSWAHLSALDGLCLLLLGSSSTSFVQKGAERIRDLDVDSVSSYYFFFPIAKRRKRRKRDRWYFLVLDSRCFPKRIDNIDDSLHTLGEIISCLFFYFLSSFLTTVRNENGRAVH